MRVSTPRILFAPHVGIHASQGTQAGDKEVSVVLVSRIGRMRMSQTARCLADADLEASRSGNLIVAVLTIHSASLGDDLSIVDVFPARVRDDDVEASKPRHVVGITADVDSFQE